MYFCKQELDIFILFIKHIVIHILLINIAFWLKWDFDVLVNKTNRFY